MCHMFVTFVMIQYRRVKHWECLILLGSLCKKMLSLLQKGKVLFAFCILTVFIIIDVFLYIRDKYTWENVFMIISAVLDGLSPFILIFFFFHYIYAKP